MTYYKLVFPSWFICNKAGFNGCGEKHRHPLVNGLEADLGEYKCRLSLVLLVPPIAKTFACIGMLPSGTVGAGTQSK